MVDLKRSQFRTIEDAMAYSQGFSYVLDFSDLTISKFVEDEFDIDFDDSRYAANGSSKRDRLTIFIATEDEYTVAKILRALWDRREGLIYKSVGLIPLGSARVPVRCAAGQSGRSGNVVRAGGSSGGRASRCPSACGSSRRHGGRTSGGAGTVDRAGEKPCIAPRLRGNVLPAAGRERMAGSHSSAVSSSLVELRMMRNAARSSRPDGGSPAGRIRSVLLGKRTGTPASGGGTPRPVPQ